MTPVFFVPLLAVLIIAGCSRQDDDEGARRSEPSTSAQGAPPATGEGLGAARSDVMLSESGTAGALAGARGTTGGPSHFGGPSVDSEVIAAFDAPSGLVDPLRGTPSLMEEPRPAPLVNAENTDIRRTRSYAMQPPTIPHKIDNYQIDKFGNKCLTCHSRTRTEETQAPPISITHYTDRSGNFLAQISPRRYFCDQCHVVQMETDPLVANTFVDVDTLLKREPAGEQRGR